MKHAPLLVLPFPDLFFSVKFRKLKANVSQNMSWSVLEFLRTRKTLWPSIGRFQGDAQVGNPVPLMSHERQSSSTKAGHGRTKQCFRRNMVILFHKQGDPCRIQDARFLNWLVGFPWWFVSASFPETVATGTTQSPPIPSAVYRRLNLLNLDPTIGDPVRRA